MARIATTFASFSSIHTPMAPSLRTMTPRRATRSQQEDTNTRAMRYLQSPPRSSQRSSTKRKIRYNEDSDDDSEIELRRKRFRDGSYDMDDEDESQATSPPNTPCPKSGSLRSSMAEMSIALWYVAEDSASAKLFRSFPVEIHQNIAKYIAMDRDVARYGLICQETFTAIGHSVWRERYEKFFDVVPEVVTEEDEDGEIQVIAAWPEVAYNLYKVRQIDTSCYVTFNSNLVRNLDDESKEMQWILQNKLLEQLKEMILDSNAKKITEDGKTKIVGKNFEFIRKLTSSPTATTKYCDVLDNLLEEDFTHCPRSVRRIENKKAETLIMVQVCLAPLILGPDTCKSAVFHFDASQKVVYSNCKNPLFKGKYKAKVNLDLVLNTLNFFKFHLKAGNGEGVLGDAYQRLDVDQYPQLWAGKIPVGTQPLTGHWKGVSVFLDPKELRMLRDKSSDENIFSDAVDDEILIDITFFNDSNKFTAKHWPACWNTIIDSDPYSELDNPSPPTTTSTTTPSKNRKSRAGKHIAKPKPTARPQVKEFWGTSRGLKTGHMFGRIHSVTNQGDMHGWQRVTMLKCFEDNKTGGFDPDQVWVYEGVVLPGGRMILGRWSHPGGDVENPDDIDSGPFIFWNVDRSTASPAIEKDEAWRFGMGADDPIFAGLFY